MLRYPVWQPHGSPRFLHGVNRLNPNKTSLSTPESRDRERQQTHWGAFLCAFQRLLNEITGCMVCVGQTQPQKKKKKETPHYSDDTTQWKAPTGKCGQLALFTEDTANLFIQHQSTTFLRENLPHDFPCPIRAGGEGAGYQTSVALLNSNEFTPF